MTEDEREKFCRSDVRCDGCWLGVRAVTRGGYGQCSIGGKARRAHRASHEVAYEVAHGVTLTPD